MAANKEVLKEFLVALGFQVNAGGLKMFMGTLVDTSTAAGKTTLALGGLMAMAEETTRAVANKLEKLYYAAKRSGESAKNIEALGSGFEQIGLSADLARSTVEGFSRAIRLNPGLVGMLKGLGVRTDSGPIAMLHDFVEQMKQLPSYQSSQYARMFGMDPDTLLMLEQGSDAMWKVVEARKAMYAKSGVDYDEAINAGREYANSLKEIGDRAEVARDKLGILLLPAFRELTSFINQYAIPALEGVILSSVTGLQKMAEAAAAALSGNKKEAKNLAREGASNLYHGSPLGWLGDSADALHGWLEKIAGKVQAAPTQRGTGASAGTGNSFSDLENRYGLPPGLLSSIRKTESNGNNNAVSPKGAQGPFQFMPETGKQYGLDNISAFDLAKSSQAAARYIHDLMEHYQGDVTKAVAAYNWGQGNLDKYGLGAAPAETRNYVSKVLGDQSKNVVMHNNTKIDVHGSGDPLATASQVGRDQDRVYSTATRLAIGKVN